MRARSGNVGLFVIDRPMVVGLVQKPGATEVICVDPASGLDIPDR